MDGKRISGLVGLMVLALPLIARADTTTAVSISVPSDCKITTAGPLALAFGTAIDPIRNAQPATPTAQFGVTCNNGTVWHLAADATGGSPVDLTSAGYTHGFAQNAAVTYTVTAGTLAATSTTSFSPATVTLTARLNGTNIPVGSYSDSFVISVMI
jgi:hypothetical protein